MMKRTEWNKSGPSPLGTPQFSVAKETSFPSDIKHAEGAVLCTDKQNSFKILSKPAEKQSETLYEVLRRRNLFEENLNLIRKGYLAKERQVFQQIQDEDELKVLIATRPQILEIQSKVKAGEGRFIDEYRTGFGSKSRLDEKKQRERVRLEFERRRSELVRDLEEFLREKVEESKRIVEGYWAGKVGDLEEKLMDMEGGRQWGENEIDELAEEVELKVKEEYEARRKRVKGKVLGKKEKEGLILKFQAELEIEQMHLLDQEKEKWQRDGIKHVQGLCKDRIKEEHDYFLQRKEKEIRKQAQNEIQEVVNRLMKDTQEVVSQKIDNLSQDKEADQQEFEEIFKQEAFDEVVEEAQGKYRDQVYEKIRQMIEKDVKKNLSQRIDMEVKIRLEDSIFAGINSEHEENHEVFRKKIEQEQVSKLLDLEYQCEANRSTQLQLAVDKRFSRTEKELKINYLKKLDKLKSELRKEFEEIYIGQIKKIRALLVQEKSEAARIKSQINVYVSKTSAEKASQIRSLQQQGEVLDRKMRDVSMRQQLDLDQSQFKPTPETSKSPLRQTNSAFSPSPIAENEVSRTIPRPLPPPSFGAFSEEVKKKSESPERRLLKNYDTKEIANSLILKNYEEAHRLAWVTLKDTEEPLKPKSTYAEISELLLTGKTLHQRETPKKHSLYNDLLKKKYGVIEPSARSKLPSKT